jgi:hypothetical protein
LAIRAQSESSASSSKFDAIERVARRQSLKESLMCTMIHTKLGEVRRHEWRDFEHRISTETHHADEAAGS